MIGCQGTGLAGSGGRAVNGLRACQWGQTALTAWGAKGSGSEVKTPGHMRYVASRHDNSRVRRCKSSRLLLRTCAMLADIDLARVATAWIHKY